MEKRLRTTDLDGVSQGLQTFVSEGHISYSATVRGSGIFRNVIVSGYVTFYQINTFFVNILYFHYWQNGPRAGVWRLCSTSMRRMHSVEERALKNCRKGSGIKMNTHMSNSTAERADHPLKIADILLDWRNFQFTTYTNTV